LFYYQSNQLDYFIGYSLDKNWHTECVLRNNLFFHDSTGCVSGERDTQRCHRGWWICSA